MTRYDVIKIDRHENVTTIAAELTRKDASQRVKDLRAVSKWHSLGSRYVMYKSKGENAMPRAASAVRSQARAGHSAWRGGAATNAQEAFLMNFEREYIGKMLAALSPHLPILPKDVQRAVLLAQSVIESHGMATGAELRLELGARQIGCWRAGRRGLSRSTART